MGDTLAAMNPLDPETVECPYPFFSTLRKDAPVHWSPEAAVWYVTRYDDCVDVLMNTKAFKGGGSNGLALTDPVAPTDTRRADLPRRSSGRDPENPVNADGEYDDSAHRRFRRLLDPFFSHRAMEAREASVRAIARGLVDSWSLDEPVEFVRAYSTVLPSIAIADFIGAPREDWPRFRRWSDNMADGVSGLRLTDERRGELTAEGGESGAYVREMVAAEWERPRPGSLITELRNSHSLDGTPVTHDEVLSIVSLMLVGGIDTTANLISSTICLLAQHPDIQEAVRADRSLIPNLVEEVLRLESPVTLLYRSCVSPTDVAGVTIPPRAGLAVVYGAANRDESQFDRPDEFDPRREDARSHLAFGRGPHYCPGAPLSRMETRVSVDILLDRFSSIRLEPASSLAHKPNTVLRGLEELYLKLEV